MVQPFIRNHQLNYIKKQTFNMLNGCQTVSDPNIIETVGYNAEARILALFPEASDDQKAILEGISAYRREEEFQNYVHNCESYVKEFPRITDKQIKKLFPKTKKLRVPDLSSIDFRYMTYLSWIDIATKKMFLIYPINGNTIGIEGRYTPLNKKSTCFLCNGHGKVAFFSAVSKSRPANASPDYYKAVGNYICLDSHVCNMRISDVAPLEHFILNIVG